MFVLEAMGSMGKKGLNKEAIVQAAVEQIEEMGLAAFSLRSLAAKLEVQVSSLYNHIEGQNDLLGEVGLRAVDMLTRRQENAIAGKERDQALFALAQAYRSFAKEHPELYRIVMGAHTLEIPVLERAAEKIAKPILRVMEDYGLEGDEKIHGQRILRSVMHGFFAHERSGGFSHAQVDKDLSYRLAIQCVADQLNARGRKRGHERG